MKLQTNLNTIIFFIFLIGIIILWVFKITSENTDLRNEVSSLKANISYKVNSYAALCQFSQNSSLVYGLYYNETMCIRIQNRTWAEMMETCSHEYLHYKYGKLHFAIQEQ